MKKSRTQPETDIGSSTDTDMTPIANAENVTMDTQEAALTTTDPIPADTNTKTAKASGRGKSKKSEQPVEPEIRVVKVSQCPSLSARSTLTYHVGCDGDRIMLRVYHNTGEGYFNPEWVSYAGIKALLTSTDSITAASLRELFQGRSVNTAGFVLAMLKDLGLIETSKTNLRHYTYADENQFEEDVAKLIASDVSIAVPETFRKTVQTSAKTKAKA